MRCIIKYILKLKKCGEILRSLGVDFNKICVFYGKCCVRIDKYVFIVVKIKYINSGKISNICDKVNFTTKLYTFYDTWQTFYQNTYKYYNFWHLQRDGPVVRPNNFLKTWYFFKCISCQGFQIWIVS